MTTIVDTDLLSTITTRSMFTEYGDIVRDALVTPLGTSMYRDIKEYYDQHPDHDKIDRATFSVWHRTIQHPELKESQHSIASVLIEGVFAPSSVSNNEILHTGALKKLEQGIKHTLAKPMTPGALDDIKESIKDYDSLSSLSTKTEDMIYTKTLEEIAKDYAVLGGGVEWRLEDLNRSIGPLIPGSLVIIGKRPETGGTSFILSELSYMLPQLPEDKHVLIINNEEDPARLFQRLVGVACAVSTNTVVRDPKTYDSEYSKFLGTKRIDILHGSEIPIQTIETIVRSGNYGVVGVNVLQKVVPHNRRLEDHDKLETLATALRNLGTDTGVSTLCVVQSDPFSEETLYPPASQLYKSKTALQGEGDVIIMIGRLEDKPDIRGIHVAKNKLPGGPKTLPAYRHLKTEVDFNPEIGYFTSRNFKP